MKRRFVDRIGLAVVGLVGIAFVLVKVNTNHRSIDANERIQRNGEKSQTAKVMTPGEIAKTVDTDKLIVKSNTSGTLPPENEEIASEITDNLEESTPFDSDDSILDGAAIRDESESMDEFADDVDIPELVDTIELEIADLLFESDFSDEEVEDTMNLIRTGGEKTTTQSGEEIDDYPDRVTFVLRFLKQTEMEPGEIKSIVQDFFPAKLLL